MSIGNRYVAIAGLLLAAAALLTLAGCTTYYTRAFRLCTPLACASPESVQDIAYGPFAELEGWRLYIHAVAIYETNNLKANDRHKYDIRIQQRRISESTRELVVDTVNITFLPSGERSLLSLIRNVSDSGYYVPEPRWTASFGDLSIPPEIDSVRIDFAVRIKPDSLTEDSHRDYSLTMLRYEGTREKFGIYPKD